MLILMCRLVITCPNFAFVRFSLKFGYIALSKCYEYFIKVFNLFMLYILKFAMGGNYYYVTRPKRKL